MKQADNEWREILEVQREAPARLRTELQELTEEVNCVKEDRSKAVFEATKAREQLKKSEDFHLAQKQSKTRWQVVFNPKCGSRTKKR
jgi:hypothetical protein